MFFFIALLSLVWSIDSTVVPYLLRKVIDTLTLYDADRAAAWPAIKWFLLFVVCLWTIVEVGFRSRGFLEARVFPKLEADVRNGHVRSCSAPFS
jgi:ATP-binding cassette subfamily B protein